MNALNTVARAIGYGVPVVPFVASLPFVGSWSSLDFIIIVFYHGFLLAQMLECLEACERI